MSEPLQILVIEDSRPDFQLTARNLRQHGIEAELHRVDNPAALEEALARGGWDAVISDYNVPALDFHQTLALLRFRMPQVPVILLSGLVYLYPQFAPDSLFGFDGLLPIALAHYLAAVALLLFLLSHIYLGTTGKTVGQIFRMMITGWHEH